MNRYACAFVATTATRLRGHLACVAVIVGVMALGVTTSFGAPPSEGSIIEFDPFLLSAWTKIEKKLEERYSRQFPESDLTKRMKPKDRESLSNFIKERKFLFREFERAAYDYKWAIYKAKASEHKKGASEALKEIASLADSAKTKEDMEELRRKVGQRDKTRREELLANWKAEMKKQQELEAYRNSPEGRELQRQIKDIMAGKLGSINNPTGEISDSKNGSRRLSAVSLGFYIPAPGSPGSPGSPGFQDTSASFKAGEAGGTQPETSRGRASSENSVLDPLPKPGTHANPTGYPIGVGEPQKRAVTVRTRIQRMLGFGK